MVHGFIKKTQKTPAEDLDLARRRMKEMHGMTKKIPIGALPSTNSSPRKASAKRRRPRR